MNGIATRLPIDLQRCRFLSSEPVTSASTDPAAGNTGSCYARHAQSAAMRLIPSGAVTHLALALGQIPMLAGGRPAEQGI